MSSHSTLILFITMMVITLGGIAVFYELTQEQQADVTSITGNAVNTLDDVELINVVGFNIEDESYKYIKTQVRYDGEGRLNLNDTHVQVRTDQTIVDLEYRNGTAERNITNGFYTQ